MFIFYAPPKTASLFWFYYSHGHGFLYYTRTDFMPLDNSQKKGQNLFGILVSSLQLTELNTFIIAFY